MRGLLPRGSLAAIVASAAAIAASALLLAGLISGGASAGTATDDSPSAARGLCPDTLCVFTQADYGGQEVDVTKLGLSNKVDNQIAGQATSLINDRESAALFYRKRDGKGRTMCINSGDGLYDLGQVQLVGMASTRLVKRRSCFPH